MELSALSTSQRWIYALKPMSWPKLLVPMLLGQGLGLWVGHDASLGGMAFGWIYTLLDLIFIVLLNDWGDRDVDGIKREMFPDGCSPKTIPDKILPAESLLGAGLAAGAIAVACGFVFQWYLGRPGLGLLGLAGLVIFGLYTFGPVKLNYRGGGEMAEMLGVGAVLPWLNAYAVGGVIWDSAYGWILGGFSLMCLASALASGLADEESDRAGGKRTFTTMFGNDRVRKWVRQALTAGILVWLIASWLMPQIRVSASLSGLVAAYFLFRLGYLSDAAVTNAFSEQKVFKLVLHRSIWWGGTIFGLLLGVTAFMR